MIVDAAKVLKQTFRESDVIARLGRDEFAVFISSCGAEDNVVSRLQGNITRFKETRKNLYHLSMSIGLAICQVDVMTSLEQMMIQTDQQMYADKRIKRM